MRGLTAIVAAAATCPKSQLQGAPRAEGHEPWTHASYCVGTGEVGKEVCVFTYADFHFGQGISVITRQDIATKLVDARLFDKSQYELPDETVEVKYVAIDREGMGIGLFVKPSEEIKAGERILIDYPTLVNGQVGDSVPAEIRQHLQWKALLQLPKTARERSRKLAKSQGKFVDELQNVIETNAFTHEKADALHDILFTEAARINHACRPNVFTRTNSTTLAMEVIALRDIHSGEEILNSYLDASTESTSEERRKKVRDEWNFICTCSICVGDGVAESDNRRRQITRVKGQIEAADHSAAKVLAHVKTLLKLYEEEGMILPRARNYWLAAVAANALGLEKQSLRFAALARKYWTIMFGEDSLLVKDVKELEWNPARHPSRQRGA